MTTITRRKAPSPSRTQPTIKSIPPGTFFTLKNETSTLFFKHNSTNFTCLKSSLMGDGYVVSNGLRDDSPVIPFVNAIFESEE